MFNFISIIFLLFQIISLHFKLIHFISNNFILFQIKVNGIIIPAFDMQESSVKGGQMHHLIVHSRSWFAGMNYQRVYLTTFDSFFSQITSGNELSNGAFDHLWQLIIVNQINYIFSFFLSLYSGREVWEGIWNQTHQVVLNFCLERSIVPNNKVR